MTGIDWLAFLAVFATALVGAAVVVALFAGGIRLVSSPHRGEPAAGAVRDEELDEVPRAARSRAATAGGAVLFTLAGLVALFGVALIVH